jgi:hypothetical protein
MDRLLKGLFLNTEKAICSIYESGKMCYESLCMARDYNLDYIELSSEKREIATDYDFYVFNYHWVQMGWLDTKFVKQLSGFKAIIVLEVSPNDPFACVSKDDFDAYIVLDPTCIHQQYNVYAFSRPLNAPRTKISKYQHKEVPVIGTFGLSFDDKGFDEVVEAVTKEFDEALIRINIPQSELVSAKEFSDFSDYLTSLLVKEKIRIEMTRYYFDTDELINWCAQNTLNIFLYNRRIGNGLSATTDQAILSGRPLAVSTNPTFRHIHNYITPYPFWSLRDAIEKSAPLVEKIQQDWSALNFAAKFEVVLKENKVRPQKFGQGKVTLPSLKTRHGFGLGLFGRLQISDFVPPVVKKITHRLISKSGKKLIAVDAILQEPFLHLALRSFSENQEDFLIDMLLNKNTSGFYVDIAGTNFFSERNTQRFSSIGWQGININSNLGVHNRIATSRPSDINLHLTVATVGAGINRASLALSDIDEVSIAEVSLKASKARPLAEILDEYFKNDVIDLLAVNVETNNLDVLKSNDWEKYRPTIIIVSASLNVKDIIRFLDRQKYLYIFGSKTNAVFVDKLTNDESVLKRIIWN